MVYESPDLPVMVALMVKVVGVNNDHIDHYAKNCRSEMVCGMLQDEEVMKLTLPVLDALTSRCVSANHHQVVAVAIQLKLQRMAR